MATLSYNEILTKKIIELDGEPFEVLSAHVFRKQQRKPVNQTKLRSLQTGRMVEQTFHQNETAQEADVEKRAVQYLYSNRGEHWFCEPGKPSARFQLSEEIVGSSVKFLKANTEVEAMLYNDAIIGIKLPIKMELKVVEAAPGVRGNSAQGATKTAILEGGAQITVPLFINVGDIVRINTDDGQYTERVSKS